MKTKILLFVLFSAFLSTNVFSQNIISDRKSSEMTYVYKLSENKTEYIYKRGIKKFKKDILTNLVDSFPTDSQFNKTLDVGYYAFVNTQEGYLQYNVYTESDILVYSLVNNRDIIFKIYNKDGKLVDNAKVFIKNKKVKFDEKTKSYLFSKGKKNGLVKIEYDDKNYYYTLSEENTWKYNYYRGFRNSVRNFNYKISGFFSCLFNPYYCDDLSENSYLVFNKPKYKPNDTVKFKAFITNKNGKPYDKQLDVWVDQYSYSPTKKIGEVSSYRDGAYSYEFVLADSLNLKVDNTYYVTLQTPKGRRILNGNFYYEDYELNNIKLSLRTNNNTTQYEDVPFLLYIQANDNNGMNLPGAKADIKISLSYTNSFFKSYSVLPYTIWETKKVLDNFGETTVQIPDSIFNKIDLTYDVTVNVKTPDYEELSQSKTIVYYKKLSELEAKAVNDSIEIVFKQNGKEISKSGELTFYSLNNEEKKQVTLPYKDKIDINVSYFSFKTDDETVYKYLNSVPNEVLMTGSRDKDSVKFVINNPHKIPVQYQIYYGNKEIVRGNTSDKFVFAEKSKNKNIYTIQAQYVWGGQPFSINKQLDLYKNTLNIELENPDKVFPGENVDFKIHVTDYKGNPVENTDLTVYSYTSKFNASGPSIPDFNKVKKSTKYYDNYSITDAFGSNSIYYEKLDFEKWHKLFDLDKEEYYKFLYTDSVYKNTVQLHDGSSQFAVFVMIDGEIQPISYILVDGIPVYFGWSNTQPYSINIDANYTRNIVIRTKNRIVRLNYFKLEKGKKNIIAINAENTTPKNKYKYYQNIEIEKANKKLSKYEKYLLYTYMMFSQKTYKYDYYSYYYNQNNEVQYLKQNDNVYKLGNQQEMLPFIQDKVLYKKIDGKQYNFKYEHFYSYEFSDLKIKMKELDKKDFPKKVLKYGAKSLLENIAYTEKSLEKDWKNQILNVRRELYYSSYYGAYSLLNFEFYNEDFTDIANIILYNKLDSNYVLLPGNSRKVYLRLGNYSLSLLKTDKSVICVDNIKVDSSTVSFYRINLPDVDNNNEDFENIDFILDSMSVRNNWRSEANYNKIAELLSKIDFEKTADVFDCFVDEKSDYSQLFKVENTTNFEVVEFGNNFKDGSVLSGHIKNKSGVVQPNSIIECVGSDVKTKTNKYGYFEIKPSANCKSLFITTPNGKKGQVDFSKTGLEITSFDGVYNDYYFGYGGYPGEYNKYELEECVSGTRVISVSKKEKSKYSVSEVINVRDENVRISDNFDFEGVSDDYFFVAVSDTAVFTNITLNGNSQDNQEDTLPKLQMSQSSIRDNFSDYAFWQPKLLTDANGDVKFSVTFPDDITRWDVNVIGMADKKLSGLEQTTIKSYKAVMSQLAIPRFLVEGDSVNVIGKTTNYTSDTLDITTNFVLNDSPMWFKKYKLFEPVIDTMFLTATRQDSMKIKYFLETETGYVDGEERYVPINRIGVEVANGHFYVLDKKSQEVEINTDTIQSNFKISAVTDELDVFLYESSRVQSYKYYCNEQLASKLYAFLAEKTIKEFQGENFKKDRQIKRIINKLEKHKNKDGLWGWWEDSPTTYWITLHVVNVLLNAQEAGYNVNVNFESISHEIVWQYPQLSDNYKLYALEILQKIGVVEMNYSEYLDKLQTKKMSVLDYFRTIIIRENAGIQVDLDSVMDYKKESLYGNIYFSADYQDYFVYNNDVILTLYAYKILKAAGNNDDKLSKIRNYLLEQRQSCWRNTYEIAMIIETVLPDFLNKKTKFKKAELVIATDKERKITEFPFEIEVEDVDNLKIKKSGDAPVYFAVYEEKWITQPNKNSKYFDVETSFDKGDTLQAGEETQLKVTLTVKKRVEYVMVEIPIPAGCSYKNKEESSYACHTEFYKDKVIMYFNALEAHSYEFTINLLPRYTGRYTLNPAKAELMYLPIFYGNNEVKQVVVEDN
ncbi:MAG: hypothetical protein JXL97_15295 [Bacteroidales bacterium]|nr:hypothetical protein [Bacteroidales bacterium]